MTEKSKRPGILTLTKEGEQEKPRQPKRPATSRRVNIERDRSKKPGPKPAPETPGKDRGEAEGKARPARARPPHPDASKSGPAPARMKMDRREGGEAGRRDRAEPRPEKADTRPARVEQFFATCPRGLEGVLAEELVALGAENVEKTGGGVGFHGPMALCYAANLHSRLATRILLRVSAGKYQHEEDVYQGALAVFWHKWFTASRTIAVKVVAQDSQLKSLNFITLRIKDAVCDRFREETGMRPSVQTLHPDIRVHAFLTRDRYTLYLDTSGESLYKRGLRKQAGLAPINENLAAGILRLSGWKPGEALYDPMCGSGTFLMEAAQMALNIAPGLGRDFAFERMLRMDAKAWSRMKAEAEKARQPVRPLPIFGSDVMGGSLRDADSNLKAAGLREAVTLSKADILDIAPPAESGVLVMNPPYGVRLGEEEELAALYPKLGDVLKRNFANWRAYIISADANLPRLIRLSASRKTPLFNGALECRLFEYKLVEGSNR
jgi:putative N6-adenine-specific DNA methylase